MLAKPYHPAELERRIRVLRGAVGTLDGGPRLQDDLKSQLHERHDASDFDLRTHDKLAVP